MCKHFADLRIPPLTRDPCHEPGGGFGIIDPLTRESFSISAKVDELHVYAADLLYRAEHVGLETKGKVPGGLAAHSGIHCENQPTTPTGGLDWSEALQAVEEGVHFRPARTRRFDGAIFLFDWSFLLSGHGSQT